MGNCVCEKDQYMGQEIDLRTIQQKNHFVGGFRTVSNIKTYFRFRKEIGSGEFGKTMECLNANNEHCAVKKIYKNHAQGET